MVAASRVEPLTDADHRLDVWTPFPASQQTHGVVQAIYKTLATHTGRLALGRHGLIINTSARVHYRPFNDVQTCLGAVEFEDSWKMGYG